MSFFRIPRDAKSGFFKHIADKFDLDFDIYYLCLMIGLMARKKEQPPSSNDTSDLVDYFPKQHSPRGKTIVALFLARELREIGIQMQDRRAVHKAVNQLVSTNSLTFLSEQGMREINRYAYGGYLLLTERFEDKPRSLETFLPAYKALLDDLQGENP